MNFNKYEWDVKYRKANQDKINKRHREWIKKNPIKNRVYTKSYRTKNKVHHLKWQREYNRLYKIKFPWIKSFNNAKTRCNPQYGKYYKKGIRMLMTKDDFKTLWLRDKACKLKQPSIDRIDNTKDYTISNCQFIELAENARKDKV